VLSVVPGLETLWSRGANFHVVTRSRSVFAYTALINYYRNDDDDDDDGPCPSDVGLML